MSKNNLLVKINRKNRNGVETWEGTASLPGLAPTKLTKARSEESQFSTRSALTSAAQKLAVRYGFSEVKFEGATSSAGPKTATKARKTTTTTPASSEVLV